MQRKESAIEVKVGALVIFSLALFAGFIFILGDFSIGDNFHIFVDFNNAGGLKTGADVRIAGIPAGRVDRIEFLGGEYQDDVGRNVYVRVRLSINEDRAEAIKEGAEFVITTLGVLGEPYIEVLVLDPAAPPVTIGAKFEGRNPIRTDEILQALFDGVQNLDGLISTVDSFFKESDLGRLLTNSANLAGDLDTLIVNNTDELSGAMASLDYILEENRDALGPILANVELMTAEFTTVGTSINRALGNGDTLRRSMASLEEVLSDAADYSDDIFRNLDDAVDGAAELMGGDQISATLENVEGITEYLLSASADVSELTDHVNSGRGAIGALLRDDEIYDDMREFIRELKRRPWRLLWRE